MGVIFSAVYYLRRYALGRGKRAISGLIWQHEDVWQIRLRDGNEHAARLQRGAFVHPWLVVVPLKWAHGRTRVAIFPDAAAADTLRHLRVRLQAWAG